MGMGTEGAVTGSLGGMAGAAGISGGTGAIPGGLGGGGGFDIFGMLGNIFKNPESSKAIADTVSKLSTAMSSFQKMPPEAHQQLGQSVAQGLEMHQRRQEMNPWMGDISRFITPEIAGRVLDELGVPYGRMRL